MFAENL